MVSPKAIAIIKEFEGLNLKPYLCPAGIPTIGYGSTFYEDGRPVSLADPAITPERAETLLSATLHRFEVGTRRAVKVSIPEDAMGALVSFAYNLGLVRLRASTLLRLVNSEDFAGAAEQFQRWNKSGGKVLAGLTRRRMAERALFIGAFNGR